MKWALSQPSRVLGMWEAFSEMFQLGHSLGHDKYMLDTWPHLLSRHVLTQELDDHLWDIYEELQVAMEANLGNDTENWKTCDALDTVRMIVNQTGSRFTVGLPLCRNRSYLRDVMSTIDSIVANAGATGFFPEWLRSSVGRVICWPTHRKIANLEKYYDGEFKERIRELEEDSPNQKVDMLQKMLRHARKHRPEELATDQMTRRMCMSSLAFVYLASYTTTNILINLLASDKQHDTVAALREEAEAFVAKYPDPKKLWTRANAADMVRADSVMRESLRLNTVPTRAVVRKVMVDGVVTDAGVALPRGSLVSFVSQPMHVDADRFSDPMSYDPFRFVRLRESADQGPSKSSPDSSEAGGNWNQHSFLSTANLLVFGRGKNSCPGRFLMDFQLKMMLSHLVLNYDIKLPDDYKGQKPPNTWVLEFIFPAKGAKFQVRRRKTGSAAQASTA
jgi:cytochrome P450